MSRERDRYLAYRTWCVKRGQPILMFPEGAPSDDWCVAKSLCRHYAADESGDVFQCAKTRVYRKHARTKYDRSRSLGRYVAIVSTVSDDIAIKWNDRHNVQRVEALRWKVMQLLTAQIFPRQKALHEEIKRYRASNKHWPLGYHPEDGCVLAAMVERPGEGIDFETVEVRDDDLLGTLALASAPTEESQELVRRAFRLRDRCERAWNIIGRLNDYLTWFFRRHPVVNEGRHYRYERRTAHFEINGRTYVFSTGTGPGEQISHFWPVPETRFVNLDRVC